MKRILAMAFPRKKILSRLNNYSEEINQHIMECVIYKDILPDTLNHWISEISSWMSIASNQKCNSELKESDYIDSLFSDFGEDVDDAMANILHYWGWNHKNKQYPDFEPTEELATILANVYDEFESVSLPLLTKGEKISSSQWKNILKDIFK